MTSSRRYMVFDYETRSRADLKVLGATEYARHASTEILCVAWRIGTRAELATAQTRSWDPRDGLPPSDFLAALWDREVVLVAHNVGFEAAITRYVLYLRYCPRDRYLSAIPAWRWLCTASLAAALALPRSLEGAGSAIGLATQKDMDGRKLLLKMCKPRKPTKHNPSLWHETDEQRDRLRAYCVTDVAAEAELFALLPMLTSFERRVWILDQVINERGVMIDRPMVTAALKMIDEEVTHLTAETARITDGRVTSTTQIAQVLAFIQGEGGFLPNLQAKTVDDALAEGMVPEGPARRLLEIRRAVGKTSTAKYQMLDARTVTDGRCRDNLMYHGAATGRWTATGVQFQNLPRGSVKDTGFAAGVVRDGDREMLRLFYGDVMSVLASCVRAALIAAPGKKFYCADYSAIEARVGFWLADHADGVAAFRDGRPIYEELAGEIFSVEVKDVSTDERQLGKSATLGCLYGMGPPKFELTCKSNGMDVGIDLAKRAVFAFRRKHQPVAKAWGLFEKTVIAAVQHPGKAFTTNHTRWFMEGQFLFCELPSGRRLAYKDPAVRYEARFPGGEKRPVLYYWCVNGTTKQWAIESGWGATFYQHATQATARDLMAAAMLRCEEAGYPIVLSVHDEQLSECDEGFGSKEEFEHLMATVPDWAAGCPVKVAGWVGNRYRKG